MGEKKGASNGKLANCTKMPVQPESAMRGEGAMRADKTECAEGRPERCGAMVGTEEERKAMAQRQGGHVSRSALEKTRRERLEPEV